MPPDKKTETAPATEPKGAVQPQGEPAASKPAVAAPAAAPAAQEAPKLTLAQRAEAGEKLTPEELAEVTGNTWQLRPNIAFGGGAQPKMAFSVAHNTAANDPRYGWNQHKLDSAEPFRLTKTAYLAALKAVMIEGPTVMEARSQYAKCPPCKAPEAPKKES